MACRPCSSTRHASGNELRAAALPSRLVVICRSDLRWIQSAAPENRASENAANSCHGPPIELNAISEDEYCASGIEASNQCFVLELKAHLITNDREVDHLRPCFQNIRFG